MTLQRHLLIFASLLLCLPMYSQVNADFSVSDTEACGSLAVNFFDQSTSNDGFIIDYDWDLVVANSAVQNPGTIYTEAGSYTICLTVTTTTGASDTECKNDLIQIFENPTALFDLDLESGCAPITGDFENLSTSPNGSLVNLIWDIGGSSNVINTTDPDRAITTIYDVPGQYSASLIVTDEKGCTGSFTHPELIDVTGVSPVELDIEVLQSCTLPWAIRYTNLNVISGVSYTWDFGNGQTYEGPTPPVSFYSDEGTYDLQIFVSNGTCNDTLVYNNIVNTTSDVAFEVSPEIACQGIPITFDDLTPLPADSLVWDFGDGSSSNDLDPNHTYSQSGCFEVILIRFTGMCSDTAIYDCLQILPSPALDYEIENQFSCELPFAVTAVGLTQGGTWSWSLGGAPAIESDTAVFVIEEYSSQLLNLSFITADGCIIEDNNIDIIAQPFETSLPEIGPMGCSPLTFSLADISDPAFTIMSWDWSIDGGQYTSTLANPTFTIPDAGEYDLTLTVVNEIGCEYTIELEDYIRIGDEPVVDFEVDIETGCRSITRNFTDLSTDDIDEWLWIFEGITTDSFYVQNPSIEFPDAGSYDVTLIVGSNGCYKTLTQENFVTVIEPDPEFNMIYDCEDPYTVGFNNTTEGADSLYWTIQTSEFGVFNSNDSIIDAITFPERGKYPISLYGINFTTGCDYTQMDTVRVVEPIASYTLDTLRGCAPFTIDLSDFSQDGFMYEYLTEGSTIDTADVFNPIITFDEGGLLFGPTLIVTDIHECTDTFQLVDTIVVNKLTADIIYDPVLCIPVGADYLDNSTSLYGDIISWEWNIADGQLVDSNPNTSFFYDTPGEFDIEFRITNDWGCKDSIILPNSVLASLLEPDFKTDTLGCTFAPVQFQVTSSNEFVDQYLWDFGDGNVSSLKNPAHTYAQEGVYNVCLTLFDYRGCDKMICKENVVTILDPIAGFTGDPTNSTCPPMLSQFTNSSANASSYVWSFGDGGGLSVTENPSRVFTSPGIFDVSLIATSTPVCSDTLMRAGYIVVEGPTAEFFLDFVPSCIPQAIEISAQSDQPYEYIWDYGNGVLDSIPGLVMSGSTSYTYENTGTFVPKVIVIDDKGCTRSFSGSQIEVNYVELAVTVEDSTICGVPNTVSLFNESSGTTNDVSYSWILDGPDVLTSSDSQPTFAVTTAGMYDVQLAATYGGCNDTLSISEIFEIAEFPIAAFDLNQSQLCKDIDIRLDNMSTIANGTIDLYQWTLPDGMTSSLESPVFITDSDEAQDVKLVVTSNLGCQDSLSKTYEVAPSLVADAGPDQLICIGDETQLSGSISPQDIDGTFTWLDDAALSCLDCFSPTLMPSDSAEYILQAIHPNGCISYDTVTVNVAPLPSPEISIDSDSIVCIGGTAIINIADFNVTYDYDWDLSDAGLDCYTNCETLAAMPELPTTYNVTVTNIYGCATEDSVRVEIELDYPSFLPDRKAVCEGESLRLSTTSGDDIEWLDSPDLSCTLCDTTTISPLVSTTYYAEVSSELGCRFVDSVLVDVISLDTLSIEADELICVGETIDVVATGTGEIAWSPTNIFSDSTTFVTQASPTNSQYLVAKMTDDECMLDDSLFIELIEKADITVSGDTICYGDQALVKSEGIADRLIWTFSGVTVSDSFNFHASPLQTTELTAIANYRTCEADSAKAIIFVYDEIKYVLQDYDYRMYLNNDIDLMPEYDVNRDYAFEWFPSEGLDCTTCPDPEIRGLLENTDYELVITDMDSGCEEEVEISVRFVSTCTEEVIGMPNIFSLRGNGANAGFGPITENKEDFISIMVFDRWGNMMYESENVDDRWNGYFGGKPAAQGVYVYKMNLICPQSGEEYSIHGDVTLIH